MRVTFLGLRGFPIRAQRIGGEAFLSQPWGEGMPTYGWGRKVSGGKSEALFSICSFMCVSDA